MKKIACIVLILLVLSALASAEGDGPPGTAQTLDQKRAEEPKEMVAARVNGTEIPMSLLDSKVKKEESRTEDPEHPQKAKGLSRKQILDRMIFEELAYQLAIAEGIQADPEKLDNHMKELEAKFGGAEGFKQTLQKMQITEAEVRADYARTLVLQRIFKREIKDRVTVTEEMIKKAYEKAKDNFIVPEQASIVDILFFLDPNKEESYRHIEKIRASLLEDKGKGPLDFASDGTFVAVKVEVDDKKQPDLLECVKGLKPGEYSQIIRSGGSLHLLQLQSYSPKKNLSFEAMKDHLKDKLEAEEGIKRMRVWEKELKKDARIEILDTSAK